MKLEMESTNLNARVFLNISVFCSFFKGWVRHVPNLTYLMSNFKFFKYELIKIFIYFSRVVGVAAVKPINAYFCLLRWCPKAWLLQ